MMMTCILLGSINSPAAERLTSRPILNTPNVQPLILVATVEGGVHGLAPDTGDVVWSFTTGSPFASTKFAPQGQDEQANKPGGDSAALLPGLDGSSLFTYAAGVGLTKLPFPAPRLVQETPFVDGHDHLFLGGRSSLVYVIDTATGSVSKLGDIESAQPHTGEEGHPTPAAPLYVSVERVSISVLDSESGAPFSNVSMGRITPSLSLADLARSEAAAAAAAAGAGASHLNPLDLDDLLGDAERPILYTDMSGMLHCIDRSTGLVLWTTELPGTIVGTFYVSPTSVLRVTPLNALGVHCLRDQCYTGSFALVEPPGLHPSTDSQVIPVGSSVTSSSSENDGPPLVLVGGSPDSGLWASDDGAFIRINAPEDNSVGTGSLIDDDLNPLDPDRQVGLIPYTGDEIRCTPESPAFPSCLTGPWMVQVPDGTLLPQITDGGDNSDHQVDDGNNETPGDRGEDEESQSERVMEALRVLVSSTEAMAVMGALSVFGLLLIAMVVMGRRSANPDLSGSGGTVDTEDGAVSNESSFGSSALASLLGRSSSNSAGVVGADTSGIEVGTLVAVEEGKWRIGDITFDTNEVLGKGSHGTMVFRGWIGERQVAVKRMLAEFYEVASREVGLLVASDLHPNVVSYYGRRMDSQFVYLALEECACSLASALADGLVATMTLEVKARMLQEAVAGVEYLHTMGIVHRDVKPQNILLTASWTAKVADFGLGAELDRGRSSFDTHTAGTLGWLAPEALAGERCTRAVDVFGLGCVIHYVLTDGVHPFGTRYERDMAILNGAPVLDQLEGNVERGSWEAAALVSRMVDRDPSSRISASAALASPFFWSVRKRLDFLMEASDRIEIDYQDYGDHGVLVRMLEARVRDVFDPRARTGGGGGGGRGGKGRADQDRSWRRREPGGASGSGRSLVGGSPGRRDEGVRRGWMALLDDELIENLGRYRKYRHDSLRDLLRVMRNKGRHYRDLPDSLKMMLGGYPTGYYEYFLRIFPKLLVVVWEVVVEGFGVGDDPAFEAYV